MTASVTIHSPARSGLIRRLAGVCVLTLALAAGNPASSADPPEYQVKAAMLYNLAKFVDWQGAQSDAPLQVCVYGKNPFGASIDSLRGKIVHGRQLIVRNVSQPEDIGVCQILFISSSERRSLPTILSNGGVQGVLTVSDMDHFASVGGVVGFVEVDGKIRLEVNLEAARQARLKINSQLLKLARIVREVGQ